MLDAVIKYLNMCHTNIILKRKAVSVLMLTSVNSKYIHYLPKTISAMYDIYISMQYMQSNKMSLMDSLHLSLQGWRTGAAVGYYPVGITMEGGGINAYPCILYIMSTHIVISKCA